MKKDKMFKCILKLFLALAVIGHWSCDEWDEHYDEDTFDLPDQSIVDYINSRDNLTRFADMLSRTGYDTVLAASQSYTVWAPDNQALEGLVLNDDELLNTVKNHIARGKVTTSRSIEAGMISGKNVSMFSDGDQFMFGKGKMIELNENTSNGLVHIVDKYAPYLNNIYEYLGATEGLDSIRNYIYSNQEKIFDPVNSVELGFDDDSKPIIDSAFIYSNEILDIIGHIDVEDSIYSVIVPNNTAWDEAYNRISKYFVFPEKFGGAERQRYFTNLYLAKDMVFSGKIEDASTLDSLTSTTGTVFHNPSDLFQGTEVNETSNGLVYVTNQMPFEDTVSWFRPRRVEAESTAYGRTNKKNTVILRSSFGRALEVSNKQYILAEAESRSSSVTFPIPNVLSAKYNVYCVFVPHSIVNSNIKKSSRVKFELTYYAEGTEVPVGDLFIPENNVTDKEKMTKMFVTQIDNKAAEILSVEYDKVLIKLEVINDVKSSETGADSEFTMDMLIDCIILEPVVE